MIGRLKFRTEDARRRERVRFALRLSALGFFGVALTAVGIFGSRLEFLRLKNTYVQTDGVLKEVEVATAIETELKGSMFGFFPKDSIFLSHAHAVEKKLKEFFPRVNEVEVQRAGLYTVKAIITERTPAALWCGDVVPSVAYQKTSDEDRTKEELWGACYLIDTEGYMYARAPLYSGNVFPRYYGSLKQAEPIAQQFIAQEQFTAWQKFYTALSKKEVFPQALLFVDERDVEIYLSNGLRILAPREEDPQIIENRLTALLESETIDKNKKVEYVDFRFDTKVFVKYWKEGE